MVYTFIKTDNTVAALYMLSSITLKSLQWIKINVTEKSPSWEANSCSATHSIPCLLHNTSVHYYFPHSLTHTLSPNFFSPPPFCSHTYSSLNIAIRAHMFSALQKQCWHDKFRDQKKWDTENQETANLMYRSQIDTNTLGSSNLKPHQPHLNHIY